METRSNEHAPSNRPPAHPERLGLIRLLFGGGIAALGGLNLVPPPNMIVWIIALLVAEWGHWLAPLAPLALLPGWHRTWTGRLGAALAVVSIPLLLLPLQRAFGVARRLPGELTAAFGDVPPRALPNAPARPAPLVVRDLWFGVASPRVRQRRGVTYVERDGKPLTLDLYLPPAEATPAPGVLVVHGGGWHSGDSRQLDDLNDYLAARGYVVAALNYRLAPTYPFPAASDDVCAALAYMRANAAELGLDSARLTLIGRSSGGHLALLVAYTAHDPAIRGVVGFYPPTDLDYGYGQPKELVVIDMQKSLTDFLGGAPHEVPDTYRQASPTSFVGPDTPPTLLIHGVRDHFTPLGYSERLDVRLEVANRRHLLLRLPWAEHGCDANFSGPGGQITTYAIERFLAAVVAPEQPQRPS